MVCCSNHFDARPKRRLHREAYMTSTDAGLKVLDLSNLTCADKIGLALSGGGFRASLFHIGIFARLAEMDLLKHVHVLSTVSGGSIIGAYYYLKIKELLEGHRKDLTGPLGRITRDCYVAIVKEIETEFLDGVQHNLRARLFADSVSNGKMFVNDEYSRSDRMGDLYDEYFYQRFVKGPTQKRILLEDIKIIPEGEDGQTFNLFDYNNRAEFKIPVLTINATSLNTGNSWHFTSSWIGESRPLHPFNTNSILKFLRLDGTYPDGPEFAPEGAENQKRLRENKFKQIRLADAVAASACVPGVFKPLAIHDLYWNSRGEEIVVQLVDGGLFDNQGVDALAKAECDYVICSDGSGQIEDELDPVTKFYTVVNRSNTILMKRVREETVEKLCAGHCAIKDWSFLHLRQLCRGDIVYPLVPGPADHSDPEQNNGYVYCLSKLRTDLDTFTDVEAYTLMYHGYMLASESFKVKGDAPRQHWRFLAIRSLLVYEPVWLLKQLKIGSEVSFKLLQFSPCAQKLLGLLGVVIVLCALIHYAALVGFFETITDFVLWVAPALLLIWGGFVLINHFFGWAQWLKDLKIALGNYRRQDDNILTSVAAGLSYPFVVASAFYVRYLDPIFKKIGGV